MSTLAILPIKSFAHAKTRLAPDLTAGPRRALTEAMFSDVLTALRRSTRLDGILVVTRDHAAQRTAGGHGAEVLEDTDEGHNVAAALGVAEAIERGFDRVLLVPGDCPLLRAGDVDWLLERPSDPPSVLVVPDRHRTGTNALLLCPPAVIAPAFGPGSRDRHLAAAAAANVRGESAENEALGLDVDTPEDLDALGAALERIHGGAAHTRGMLNQLLRSRA